MTAEVTPLEIVEERLDRLIEVLQAGNVIGHRQVVYIQGSPSMAQ
jgi:hypothetical protein